MRGAMALWALVGCSGSGGGPADLDGDGYTEDVDCDDRSATVNPAAREVCDGFDNDCDGDIDDDDSDVDVTGFTTFFFDNDGDGYGTADTPLDACSPPAGYVANNGDCDDDRVLVSPEQNEKCDGLDNDCDPYTIDNGVAFQHATGEWLNLTSTFRGGSAASPEGVTFQQDGTLFVCEGNYYVSLRFEADVEVRGLSGAQRTVLDGGGVRPVVWVDSPVDVSLTGLTLQNGHDGQNAEGFGASLHCERRAVVSGTDLVIEGGPEQTYGGAVSAIDDCELSLTTAELRFGDAVYGGLMYVSGAEVSLDQVGFLEGVATGRGGALTVGAMHRAPQLGSPGTVSCTNCSFQSNTSIGVAKGDGGGGVFLTGAGELSVSSGLFADNHAAGTGGAVLIDSDGFGGAALTVDGVVFDGNSEDALKTANDIAVPVLDAAYLYDVTKGAVSLTCDEDAGCTE